MNKAITYSLLFLAGAIAFSALSELAIVFVVVRVALFIMALLWGLSLTAHGHDAAVQIFKLSDAQLGVIRLLMVMALVTGVAVNLSFEELPSWMAIEL